MRMHQLSPFVSAMRLPDSIAFSFAGFDIYWAGLFISVGVIALIFLAQYEANRKRMPADSAVDLCIIGIPLGVVFARLAYVLLHLSYYKTDPVSALYFWDGGLSLYGAYIGVLLGIALYSLKKKLAFLRLTDLLVPGVLVMQALSLWGNFFDQIGYGPEVTNSKLQWFPFAVLIENPNSIRCALFFYEFLWCALLFAAVWFLIRKKAKRDGAASLWYLLLYPLGHAAVGMFRADGETLYGTFGALQIVCLVLSVFALVLLLLRAKRPVLKTDSPAGEEAVSGDEPSEPSIEGETSAEDETPVAKETASLDETPAPKGEADEKPEFKEPEPVPEPESESNETETAAKDGAPADKEA